MVDRRPPMVMTRLLKKITKKR